MEFKISKKYKLIEDIHLASGIKYFFYKKIDFPYIHIFRGLTEFQITEVRYPLNIFYHSYYTKSFTKILRSNQFPCFLSCIYFHTKESMFANRNLFS